jgi:hypothetical protein
LTLARAKPHNLAMNGMNDTRIMTPALA